MAHSLEFYQQFNTLLLGILWLYYINQFTPQFATSWRNDL